MPLTILTISQKSNKRIYYGTGSSSSSRPSHQYLPSAVFAVLVKMEFVWKVAIALPLVFQFVPGQTPKNPDSGLIPRSSPFSLNLIQAMSSPKQLSSTKCTIYTRNHNLMHTVQLCTPPPAGYAVTFDPKINASTVVPKRIKAKRLVIL